MGKVRNARWRVGGAVFLLAFIAIPTGTARGCLFSDYMEWARPDIWRLTRESSAVAVGRITSVSLELRMSVDRVLNGEGVPPEITFVEPMPPPLPPIPPVGDMPDYQPSEVGQKWIVFLGESGGKTPRVIGAVGRDVKAMERAVLDCLAVDAIGDPEAKCRGLVDLSINRPDIRWYSLRDLAAYEDARFLGCLDPLRQNEDTKSAYVSLLAKVPQEETTGILADMLQESDPIVLIQVIRIFHKRALGNAEISKRICHNLRSGDSYVRSAAIQALKNREFWAASREVAECLDDSDPLTRAAAIHWPWRRCPNRPESVVPTLRRLAREGDELTRGVACRALIDLGDVRSFPMLWMMDLRDSSEFVRRTIDMGQVFRSCPCVLAACLGFSMVGAALFSMVSLVKRMWRRNLVLKLTAGLGAGYVIGGIGGCLLGMWRTLDPVAYSFVLTPAVTTPMGVLLAPCLPRLGGWFLAGLRGLLERDEEPEGLSPARGRDR